MARPYAIRRARLVPDLADPDLYGAWGMKPQGGLLVDHTPQGNDGVPGLASVVENTILGPMRRYLPNSGAGATIFGAAGAFALSDLTASFWCRMDPNAAGADWLFNYYQNVNDAWGVRISAGSVQLYDDIDNAGAALYSTAVPVKLTHVVAVMDSLENLLYVDGVLVGSGTAASDDWASFNGTLYHGDRVIAGANTVAGIVGPALIHNAAKDQDWATQDYLKGARAVQFKTSWGVRISVGNETANARVGANSSPYEIISGTHQMVMNSIEGHDVKAMEVQAGGAGAIGLPTSLYEATPTEAAYGGWRAWGYKDADANNWIWMPVASEFDVPAGATQDGYQVIIDANEAVQLQRITNGAVAATVINSGAAYVALQTWYEFWLTRRYDGLWSLWIRGGAFAVWTLVGTGTDNTHTTAFYQIHDNDPGDMVGYANQKGDYCSCKMLGAYAP